ncbi:MAG TPA: hypothetical protein DCY52_01740, partial [Methylococcaceae bacterium]|nr:hypothetical protein [Methylococcaceae bacterium]
METWQFVEGYGTGRKTLFKIIAAVVIGFGQGPRGDAGILTCISRIPIAPHANPIIGLGLFEIEAPFLVFQCEKMATLLAIFQALLPTGQPIP